MNSTLAPYTVVRTPAALLHADAGQYGDDTLHRYERFGFHLTTDRQPARDQRSEPASIVCGPPVDPAWDDNQTLFFALNGRTDTARALLITAAWQHAAQLGVTRMAGCTGRHRCTPTSDHPHPGYDDCRHCLDLRPCALIIPGLVPPCRAPRGQLSGIGRPLTEQLWEHPLARRGPALTYFDLHGFDPDDWDDI